MKKLNHIILVPVFNDWKSFNRLTFEIEKKFKFLKGYNNQILVINDKSTIKKKIKKKHFKNISNIKTLDLKKNCGSQKAIAIGLFYLKKIKRNFIITVMDGDGEDQPQEIIKMLRLSRKYKNYVITSNRKKERNLS